MDIKKVLKAVDVWKKEHAPWAYSAEGWEVFMWLLSTRPRSSPLKTLYLGSRFSEFTLRAALRQCVEAGIVVLTQPDGDRRQQIARTTDAFDAAVTALRQLIDELHGGCAAAAQAGD